MAKTQVIVRRAQEGDVAFIAALIDRVQKKLTDSGSLQLIGPVSLAMVESYRRSGSAYILVASGRRVGSVFVEAATAEDFPLLEKFELANTKYFLWHLCTLAIEPDEQGRGLGYHFLEGVRAYIVARPAMIFLDCWAGNAKLRTFYMQAGFQLHGVYGSGDYEVAVFTMVIS